MEQHLKTYEKSIKKIHRFGLSPNYKEDFRIQLSGGAFLQIAKETFDKLGWQTIYADETDIHAKRAEKVLGFNQFTEGISVSFQFGKVTVKSESLGNEIWDNGRNSRRVKLFIHVFRETEKSYDKNEIKQLETELEKQQNWNDYVVPEVLPKEKIHRTPNLYILLAGALVLSLILAFVLALISVKGVYIIGLFEVLIALAISFAFKFLIKISNYTDFKNLTYVLIGTIVSVYFFNQHFQYEIILRENHLERIGFLNYMTLKFQNGLKIKSQNTGAIGLLISWIIQIGLTLLISYLRLASIVTTYKINRIPPEVIDFAFYHFVKDKPEQEVRNELSEKGWKNRQSQDEVFQAIGAVQDARDLSKIS